MRKAEEATLAQNELVQVQYQVRCGAEALMNLFAAEIGQTYLIKEIDTDDVEMDAFLFSLGAYSGEPVTVLSKKRKSCIVVIKNSRYSIDKNLAESVLIAKL